MKEGRKKNKRVRHRMVHCFMASHFFPCTQKVNLGDLRLRQWLIFVTKIRFSCDCFLDSCLVVPIHSWWSANTFLFNLTNQSTWNHFITSQVRRHLRATTRSDHLHLSVRLHLQLWTTRLRHRRTSASIFLPHARKKLPQTTADRRTRHAALRQTKAWRRWRGKWQK